MDTLMEDASNKDTIAPKTYITEQQLEQTGWTFVQIGWYRKVFKKGQNAFYGAFQRAL